MATNHKNFVVKHGLTVASEGITFSDGTTQTTASTGGSGLSITVGSTFPTSPQDGQMHLDTVSNRVYYYSLSTWNAFANHDDTLNVTEHTHNPQGFVGDTYLYTGNGVILPSVLDSWSPIDGGSPTSTYTVTIDGGTAA